MVIRRFGPLSFAKISGVLYALMGLIFGAIISAVSIVGGVFGAAQQGGDALAGMMFGAAAVVVLPIFYGVLGFVMSLIGAALYNVVAGFVGGIQMDVE
ncbi:MAG TPA: hypothetical protein VF911_11340 [Thermoanaerobaculia bacterium]|jgi:hypothetical protein